MIERVVRKNETNVAVAPKEPLFMSPLEQLEVMIEYTKTHQEYTDDQKLEREMACLKVLFPTTFRPMYEDDLILGRIDVMPVGFGSVTSLGGPSHYCNFGKLEEMKALVDESHHAAIDDMLTYWKINDTREGFYKEHLIPNVLGRFVDVYYPAIVTTRFSGIYLDYNKLLDHGINGLIEKISQQEDKNPESKNEYHGMEDALHLLQSVIAYHLQEVENKLGNDFLSPLRTRELVKLRDALTEIKSDKPTSFIAAMQLAWLYSTLAGVVNFGRMDDYLGTYLVADLELGAITEEEAIRYIKSQWQLIEVKRTNVNGRVVVGGKGRRNEKNADVFCRLAIEATRQARLVEPQFTLRIYDGMDTAIYDAALQSIGEGTTYPILYNDDVNIPSVMHAMQVDEKTAEQYVPFGCGEFTISGQGIGTPNSCVNVLKALDVLLHDGVDQWDYQYKYGTLEMPKVTEAKTFEAFFELYKKLLTYYLNESGKAHRVSYDVMNSKAGFIFSSILTADCITKGKTILDGGVRFLGGTNEMYGNMSTVDSLMAIKKLVYDDEQYTLEEFAIATAADFDGYEQMHRDVKAVERFGNDLDEVDEIAVELHEFLSNTVRDQAKELGMDSYLIVVINNQVNTEWGRATATSADGRLAGVFMSNAINPQSGADTNGPTAMLNSILKMRTDLHGGAVQNIKFSRNMFNQERPKIKYLFETYFKDGGAQLMVTIVSPEELEEAYKHPELHQDLTVRVGGFSARFVNLEDDVQREIMERTLNE